MNDPMCFATVSTKSELPYVNIILIIIFGLYHMVMNSFGNLGLPPLWLAEIEMKKIDLASLQICLYIYLLDRSKDSQCTVKWLH